MLKVRFYILFFLLFFFTHQYCQEKQYIDSLENIVSSNQHDTVRINALKLWDDEIYITNPSLDIELNEQIINISEVALASKKLNKKEELFYKKALIQSYNIIGINNDNMGFYASALDYYYKSLSIAEEILDSTRIGAIYNNIGLIHERQNNYSKALEFYRKSLQIVINKDQSGTATALNNIANLFQENLEIDSALYYYNLALEAIEITNDLQQKGSILGNIGVAYEKIDQFDSSLAYHEQAINLLEDIGEWDGLSNSLYNVGMIYYQLNDYEKAINYCQNGLNVSKSHESIYRESLNCECLYRSYKANKNFDVALNYFERLDSLSELLVNEESTRIIAQKEMAYQHEKEMVADSIQHQHEINLSQSELKAQKKQRTILFIGLIMIVIFLAFIFNRLKVTRKQKEEINQQKSEIEVQKLEVESAHEKLAEHHQEIKDSIMYAKRIQDAIMPSMEAMNKALGNGFVLYLPKDVVAGDFFWLETSTSSNNKQEVIYFAAADCTGHGVPGAMVSVVCSNALTKALLEEKITDTGKLLDRTRELVITQLAKSGEEVKDGMDISLCALNKKTMQLNWSGANNPLWILRKDANDFEIIKADKQPIGVTFDPSDFTSHNIQLNIGDRIYVFTDGYQDQFGGEKGKKFKAAQLKQILVEHKNTNIYEQEKILLSVFNRWKGKLEQIDDVCIIGLEL